jgi:hypothetical protein
MSWGNIVPLVSLTQQLVETRLRSERIRLAQRLRMIEDQAARQGITPPALRRLLKGVPGALPIPPVDRVDVALVTPPKPDGIWRKKYLAVRTRTGSIF